MRDKAGSAAAPATRCRNWGGEGSWREACGSDDDHSHARAFPSPDTLSRPHRAVIAKRDRGPRPVRRRFRQLHGWLEVAESAGWGLTDRRPTSQFAGGELSRYIPQRRCRHFAEIDNPFADLGERDPHQPAATFLRPACQRHHRAKRHQVTRAIIDRRDRVELWLRSLARDALRLTYRDAADGLHHRVEAAP